MTTGPPVDSPNENRMDMEGITATAWKGKQWYGKTSLRPVQQGRSLTRGEAEGEAAGEYSA